MTTAWTPEAALALAPDPGSAKAAQGLAAARQWQTLGRSEIALWGEIKGSGATPYQARIDLREPAFKCSCPSRKFPCKHGLALLVVHAREPQAFTESAAPGWVTEWLDGRGQRAERRAEKAAAEPVVDAAAQQKRIAQREARIAAGLDQLGVWLEDLMRMGLAHAQTQPSAFWDGMIARLVDAQAPGLARLTRALDFAAHSGSGWEDRLMHGVARLALIRRAYLRQSELAPALADEARSAVGWTQSQDELGAQPGVRDRWRVMGAVTEGEDRLRVRRTWLAGRASARPALLLDFAAGSQPLDAGLPAGAEIDGELAFYPGALGLRAALRAHDAPLACADPLPASGAIEAALDDYASALGRVPWLDRWPMTVSGVTVRVHVREETAPVCTLVDSRNASLALPPRFALAWHLLAVSGGEPIDVFGEWDGEFLRPLSIGAGTALYSVAGGALIPLRHAVTV